MDIVVTVPALPGPGATVLGGAAVFAPGGKGANQAVAAARLGGAAGMTVAMVGFVRGDGFGPTLRRGPPRPGRRRPRRAGPPPPPPRAPRSPPAPPRPD